MTILYCHLRQIYTLCSFCFHPLVRAHMTLQLAIAMDYFIYKLKNFKWSMKSLENSQSVALW